MFAIVGVLCPSVVCSAAVAAVFVSVPADATVVTVVSVIYNADEDKPVQVLL